jgi:ankyrin repeat protein
MATSWAERETMSNADFIEWVAHGDEEAALDALMRDPTLADAKTEQGVSVVCLAIYRGRSRVAAALAAARPDLDVFEASCLGDLDRVRALLDAEPTRVDAVSPDGFSPVGYSAFFGHPALLRELVARGGDVNAASRNAMRVCPLHSAAAHSDQAKAVLLAHIVLEAGAAPNARQQGGFTALHEAVLNRNRELVQLLLRHRADPELANDAGVSPLDLAREAGDATLLALLEHA